MNDLLAPESVEDFVVEETEREFEKEYLERMRQLGLFESRTKKPLEKIPYKFFYKFRCEESGCKGHRMMIEDWEAGQLYRSMRDKFKDERVACEKVRDKFYGQICSPDRDVHFFVGTILQYGTWIILGTFWPERELI